MRLVERARVPFNASFFAEALPVVRKRRCGKSGQESTNCEETQTDRISVRDVEKDGIHQGHVLVAVGGDSLDFSNYSPIRVCPRTLATAISRHWETPSGRGGALLVGH